ncbi:cAMP-dependent protein kinase subunit [Mycoemilia scoparia]|uniref:cAMP-dependent protein kinase subunit n=1 Tax=Mycoemilia scoparia TaxID=417184 RepID=A0A9W8DUZ6_9FUNG|nr:cAMP-dependent protein kinase subunit [Mycoemilia scoparia]
MVLSRYIPDAVVGDLDSIFSHVKDFYNEKGSEINKIVDDNSTDFMKTISYINDRHGKDVVIIVFGGFGGRLDHAMHTLRILNNEVHSHRSIMVSDECITFAIPKGTTQIMFSKDFDGPACGLLPLAGPITLSTQGLRWNLDNHPSSFEGLMSTSNIIDGPKVIVDTTNTLIWTSEFRPLKQ